MFGESQQVPHARGCYQCGDGSGGAISPLRAALSAHAAVFYRPLTRVVLKQNMSWHDPELYLFLCVLAVFTALLAITYELVSRRRKPPVILMRPCR